MHNLIYKYPRNEFAGGHKSRTPYHLFPQRGAPAGPYPLLGKEHQTYAAQQEHGPVGKSPKYHFKSIIERPAQSSQK